VGTLQLVGHSSFQASLEYKTGPAMRRAKERNVRHLELP
jgi:hypothetical protein